jgi:hypothetical protein
MHETARCFGYPSDSTRAARERAREATCGHCLRWSGLVQPGRASSTRRDTLRRPSPLWLNSLLRRLSPSGSSLAGVGHCPIAIGHGCLVGAVCVGLLAGVLDRRPVSPLPSPPACSGAGSGWHRRMQIADSTVYLGGPATGGAGPVMCADSWAVTVWRIASAARLRRPRGHRAERGQLVLSSRHHCGCSLGQAGILPEPGPSRARTCAVTAQPATGQWPAHHSSGQWPAHYSTGQWPAHHRQAAPAPVPGRHRLGRRGPRCRAARDPGCQS